MAAPFHVPAWTRPLLAAAFAAAAAVLCERLDAELVPKTAGQAALLLALASLFAGINLVAADLGRGRSWRGTGALAALFGAIVTGVWSAPSFPGLSFFEPQLQLTYAYSAAFGALVGARLSRAGALRRARAIAVGAAGAACGAFSWWLAIYLTIGSISFQPQGTGAGGGPRGLGLPGAFAAAIEIGFWAPLVLSELAAFRAAAAFVRDLDELGVRPADQR